MGKGIDAARDQAPAHAAVMDDFKDQLLIVCMKRLKAYGDNLKFPVSEVDDTKRDMLAFSINDHSFKFELTRKS